MNVSLIKTECILLVDIGRMVPMPFLFWYSSFYKPFWFLCILDWIYIPTNSWTGKNIFHNWNAYEKIIISNRICWCWSIYQKYFLNIVIFFVFWNQIWLNYIAENAFLKFLYKTLTNIVFYVKISQQRLPHLQFLWFSCTTQHMNGNN